MENTPQSDFGHDADSKSWHYCLDPDEWEAVQDYRIGGFHPVVIRDRIHDRYEILHKLGFGVTATVWLARDHEAARNVALKIFTAESTTQSGAWELAAYRHLQSKLPAVQQDLIVPLYDSFTVNGPNGTHLCLSLGLSGPSLNGVIGGEASMKIRPDVAQQLALRVAEGLSEIHKTGITYNDFTPGNILLQLDDAVATWSENELYSRLGHPKGASIVQADSSRDIANGHTPAWIYPPLSFTDADKLELLRPAIKFIDFAGVRYDGEPEPEASHGLTLPYADPEVLFWRQKETQAADVWSLACILFELRASDMLIPEGWKGLQEVKNGTISCIGPMPGKWRQLMEDLKNGTTTCIGPVPEEWRKMILNDSRTDGIERVVVDGDNTNEQPQEWNFDDVDFGDLERQLAELDAKEEGKPLSFRRYEGISQPPKPLEDEVRGIGIWTPWCHMSVDERMEKLKKLHESCGDASAKVTREECDTGEPPHGLLSNQEAIDFIELLKMMLTWCRYERASLEEVLRHRWFTTDYGCDKEGPWVQRYHSGYRYFVNGEQLV